MASFWPLSPLGKEIEPALSEALYQSCARPSEGVRGIKERTFTLTPPLVRFSTLSSRLRERKLSFKQDKMSRPFGGEFHL